MNSKLENTIQASGIRINRVYTPLFSYERTKLMQCTKPRITRSVATHIYYAFGAAKVCLTWCSANQLFLTAPI